MPADGKTTGEIVIRGNTVMQGYLHDEDATEKAFAGGVFHSGDLAVVHPDGRIQVRDRLKDVIISGGENVSSVEVEGVLYRHPAVAAAAVVAKPDDRWGEVPCAFVELRPGAAATEAELIAFCRERLAGFKTPKAVVFGEIPKTSTGKIQKFELRERVRAAAATTWVRLEGEAAPNPPPPAPSRRSVSPYRMRTSPLPGSCSNVSEPARRSRIAPGAPGPPPSRPRAANAGFVCST